MKNITGAVYDDQGSLLGIYSCPNLDNLLAQVPSGGRSYVIPSQAAQSLPIAMAPVRDMLRDTIKESRDEAQQGGCDTPSGRVDTDTVSQLKITGAVVTAQIAPAGWSIDWTMADNSVVTLDAPAMIAIGLAVSSHVDACHQYGRTLGAALESANTIPDAYAVIEGATWPN